MKEPVNRESEEQDMDETKPRMDTDQTIAAQFPDRLDEGPAAEDLEAWELIDPETGRYMPRRIRGSFRGRALG
ncbi:MAG: hypothetical protein OSB83_11845 [Planctomycetota bacterium]|nr:hypothetical protein [Planctomycetota bacterium]HBO51925.1 hypothetical protein [Planctomycetota bacterium]